MGWGGGDSLLAYWTAPLLSPVLARWSKSMKLTQLFSFPHNEFFFPLFNLTLFFLCSHYPLSVTASCPTPSHQQSVHSPDYVSTSANSFSLSFFLFFTIWLFDTFCFKVHECWVTTQSCRHALVHSLKCGFPSGFVHNPTLALWVQPHQRYLSFRCFHQYELCQTLSNWNIRVFACRRVSSSKFTTAWKWLETEHTA